MPNIPYLAYLRSLVRESMDILGDRFVIEIRGDRCFDVVDYAGGDRLCGGSVDILGDRFVIEIRGDRIFLGIDHTAIAVGNTETSLKFYRDLLGMRLAGTSENFGTEQEHLNNVFGAKLHISGLRATTGLGVEFLEYLAPSDGKPFP
ncbi:hypothetical protein TUMEXPCC7403_08165 [Tumidithrix helvetica PCC 7403]